MYTYIYTFRGNILCYYINNECTAMLTTKSSSKIMIFNPMILQCMPENIAPYNQNHDLVYQR